MMSGQRIFRLAFASWLSLSACTAASDDEQSEAAPDRARALERLQLMAGGEVAMQVGETGATRLLAMAPRFPVRGNDTEPAAAAIRFITEHHDVFQLRENEAGNFAVTRVDSDPVSDVRHVTLQRLVDGDPVFHGTVTVHMTGHNDVFRAFGDDLYRVSLPTNRKILTPADAALAAAAAFQLTDIDLSVVSREPRRTVFSSPRLLDTLQVTPMVFQVAPDDSRFVYQVTLTWNDENRRMQYQLVLVDAATGNLLRSHSLVNAFTGRVFAASPGANPAADGRAVLSFDGDPAASPEGWVGSARRTTGNNVVAATDLDADNRVGANEIQPTADAKDSFDFPFSATQDAATLREAGVANAFWLANQWHDRTYLLGFTESAGNFQTSNYGKGGAQYDEVQVDVQDGAGIDSGNFATPPDGQRPRMQTFLFDLAQGSTLRRDGDFDPSVIYHELTHGLSNRLVGGGTTGCLENVQSGGMGEGWSDFIAASFLGDPVIGAYVTGNATVGIRRASMASSPFTYADIQNRNLAEVRDVGELWAATLWDIRTAIGSANAERLVVDAMKLTPCRPSMLEGRDAILQAAANLDAGANRCKLWTAFANRGMGVNASSPNDASTTSIVTSTALPISCTTTPGNTRTFTSKDVPVGIPDNDAGGARGTILVPPTAVDILRIGVNVSITHPYRGDLIVQVIAPDGTTATLTDRQDGSADNFSATKLDLTGTFVPGTAASGTWQLFVRDAALNDVGTINSFSLTIRSTN